MADYGLLSGLGNALSSGLSSYRDTKQADYQKQKDLMAQAMQNRLAQATLQKEGYQAPDPTDLTAPLQYTPLKQKEMQKTSDTFDPSSDVSKQAQSTTKSFLDKSGLDSSIITPNMSADDIDKNPLLKSAITASFGAGAKNAFADAYRDVGNKKAQATMANTDIRRDDQKNKVINSANNDSLLKQAVSQGALVDRGIGILQKPTLTNQEFNDVQIELGNAIAGAKSAALGKLERTEYDTAAQKLADLKQKLTGEPQDAVPEEIKAQVLDLAQHMKTKFAENAYARAKQISTGKHFSSDDLQKGYDENIENYNPNKANGLIQAPAQGLLPNQPAQGAAAHPQDSQAVQWAKANPTDPRSAQILKANGM